MPGPIHTELYDDVGPWFRFASGLSGELYIGKGRRRWIPRNFGLTSTISSEDLTSLAIVDLREVNSRQLETVLSVYLSLQYIYIYSISISISISPVYLYLYQHLYRDEAPAHSPLRQERVGASVSGAAAVQHQRAVQRLRQVLLRPAVAVGVQRLELPPGAAQQGQGPQAGGEAADRPTAASPSPSFMFIPPFYSVTKKTWKAEMCRIWRLTLWRPLLVVSRNTL